MSERASISLPLFNQILETLGRRPFVEVAQLIKDMEKDTKIIKGLPEPQEDTVAKLPEG